MKVSLVHVVSFCWIAPIEALNGATTTPRLDTFNGWKAFEIVTDKGTVLRFRNFQMTLLVLVLGSSIPTR